MNQSIFKAYDIRGIYPSEIDEHAVYKIAQAYAKFIQPKTVVLGRDVRTSGVKLWEAAKKGLIDHGVEVIDIGVIATDMLYFAVAHYGYDGGITISASHNPAEYNGMKMVRAGAVPISGDSGLKDIQKLVKADYSHKAEVAGQFSKLEIQEEYVAKCLSFINPGKVKPFKIVANAMFGPAMENVGHMDLPLKYKLINEIPDGSFPKGPPDPLLEQNRTETTDLIIQEQADFGVAWDGDADRFFLFDENGRFIPGYYLTAFLGEYFSKKNPGNKIITDARLVWATLDKVNAAGGVVLLNKAGHSFIKERMHQEDAVFAGESSGHYYFKDYFYCDNGLIPFLLLLEIFSNLPDGQKISEVFDPYFEKYLISGEINNRLPSQTNIPKLLNKIAHHFLECKVDNIDGLSLEHLDWRANIHASNTEPLLRLNVEGKNPEILRQSTEEILRLIRA